MELNAKAVANFWQNRSQFTQSADDAGLSYALVDDQLDDAEFHELKIAYLAQNPDGDFESFLADALDGKVDGQSLALFRDKIAQMGAEGSALAHINFETNLNQDGYENVAAVQFHRNNDTIELKPASKAQMQAAVDKALNNSFKRVPDRPGESRHELNQRLQNKTAAGQGPGNNVFYDGSDVVVIAFEGTGAFETRRPHVMQEAAEILKEQGLSSQGRDLYDMSTTGLKPHLGSRDPNWSGLGLGPMTALLNDPEQQNKTQWLSFPSEEIELLAHPKAYKATSFDDIVQEMTGSYVGHTPGIQNALSAMQDIQMQARAQGKNPKFVVVSHSSGGRSAIKFLEKAKMLREADGSQLKFPFVMTIDPVREAHEAVGEAIVEIINKGTEHNANRVRAGADAFLNFLLPGPSIDIVPQRKVYPPTVGFDDQKNSLYKTHNTEKFQSFYQRDDTEGLKLEWHPWLDFGIHGSKVEGADNIPVYGVGSSGHGNIATDEKVVKAFMNGLAELK